MKKLIYRFSPNVSAVLLVCIILFGLFLTYMLVQAQKISDGWQKANNQAVQLMESIK